MIFQNCVSSQLPVKEFDWAEQSIRPPCHDTSSGGGKRRGRRHGFVKLPVTGCNFCVHSYEFYLRDGDGRQEPESLSLGYLNKLQKVFLLLQNLSQFLFGYTFYYSYIGLFSFQV